MKLCDYYEASLSNVRHFIWSAGLLEREIFKGDTTDKGSFGVCTCGFSSDAMLGIIAEFAWTEKRTMKVTQSG
jgi:hypothetical protein